MNKEELEREMKEAEVRQFLIDKDNEDSYYQAREELSKGLKWWQSPNLKEVFKRMREIFDEKYKEELSIFNSESVQKESLK